MTVTDTEPKPTGHLSLSDGTTTINIVAVNGRGQRSVKGIAKSSMPRTTMRIGQGEAGYADTELPYTPSTQKDWGGGLGSEAFEEDKTRYREGYIIDTSHGDIICGPLKTAATGYYSSYTVGDSVNGDLTN